MKDYKGIEIKVGDTIQSDPDSGNNWPKLRVSAIGIDGAFLMNDNDPGSFTMITDELVKLDKFTVIS